MEYCTVVPWVSILTVFTMIKAQDPVRVEPPPHTYQAFFTKIGCENWGYGGIDVVGSDSMVFPFSNPALLSAEHLSAGIELAKNENSRDPFSFKFANRWLLPSYAVIQFPLKAWKMAAGYANYYDLHIVFDPEEIRTLQQPAGTGEYLEAQIKIQLHNFFYAVQYSIHPKFSIGLNLGANYLRRREEIFRMEARGDDWDWQSAVGLAYIPDDNLTFAASFKYLGDINYTIEISGNELLIAEPDTGIVGGNEPPIASLQQEFTGEARFPWEIKLGLSYRFLSVFQIFSMINFQKWSRVNSMYDDQQQFHIGLQARAFPTTHLSFGFFTQWEADDRDPSIGKYLSSKFITLGLSQKLFRKFQFNISYLDSRLFTDPEVERSFAEKAEGFYQSRILLGLQYIFL